MVSKSLFVDYKEFPKLTWWKQNNLDKYKWIKWIEDEETSENLIELWQKVKDLAWEYFLKKEWLLKLDVFEDNSAKNPNDEEDEDVYLIQDNYKLKRGANLKNRHNSKKCVAKIRSIWYNKAKYSLFFIYVK